MKQVQDAINGEEGASRADYNNVGEDDNQTVTGVEGSPGGMGYFGFSFYQEKVPGLFYFLGGMPKGKDPQSVSVEEALVLIAERAAKDGGGKAKAKKAPAKAAKAKSEDGAAAKPKKAAAKPKATAAKKAPAKAAAKAKTTKKSAT